MLTSEAEQSDASVLAGDVAEGHERMISQTK